MTAPTLADELSPVPARLAQRAVSLGRPLVVQRETDSTNDDAKRGAKEGAPHGAVWVADVQTAGRGRQGRSWSAAPGEALLLSVLLRSPCPLGRVPLFSLAAGLAVRDAVAAAAPSASVGIKWPNDVVVAGRKVAGILVESAVAGDRVQSIVVGVGINVQVARFPEELSLRACSVAELTGTAPPPSRADLLVAVLEGLDALVPLVVEGHLAPVLERIAAWDVLRGVAVSTDGRRGVAEGIDDGGRLLVRDPSGTLDAWYAGEVHIGAGAAVER